MKSLARWAREDPEEVVGLGLMAILAVAFVVIIILWMRFERTHVCVEKRETTHYMAVSVPIGNGMSVTNLQPYTAEECARWEPK